MKEATKKLLTTFASAWSDHGFSSAIQLFDQEAYFRQLDEHVTLIWDSKETAADKVQAKFQPRWTWFSELEEGSMYLDANPMALSKKEKDQVALGQTIWHELTHSVELSNDDFAAGGNTEEYGERNAWNMENHLVPLAILVRMERLASSSAPDVRKMKTRWNVATKRFRELAKDREKPESRTTIGLLNGWFGFRVTEGQIRQRYLSLKPNDGPKKFNQRQTNLLQCAIAGAGEKCWEGAWDISGRTENIPGFGVFDDEGRMNVQIDSSIYVTPKTTPNPCLDDGLLYTPGPAKLDDRTLTGSFTCRMRGVTAVYDYTFTMNPDLMSFTGESTTTCRGCPSAWPKSYTTTYKGKRFVAKN